jgi:rRNA processing protein Krr1/Pno1
VGIIIGHRGKNIKELQENLKVEIRIDSNKRGTGIPNLLIIGPPTNTQKAKATILEKYRCRNLTKGCTRHDCKFLHLEKEIHTGKFGQLGKREPSLRENQMQNHEIQMQMCIPHSLVGIIIGRQGKTIRDLQKHLEVRMKIHSENRGPGIPNLLILGPPTNVQRAKETIVRRYQCRNMSHGCDKRGCKFLHSETEITPNKTGQPREGEHKKTQAVDHKFRAKEGPVQRKARQVNSSDQAPSYTKPRQKFEIPNQIVPRSMQYKYQ